LEFFSNGQRLCAGSVQTFQIWDVGAEPFSVDVCHGHDGFIACVAFSPDGRLFASSDTDPSGGRVFVWDAATGQLLHKLEGHTDWTKCVVFSPDGKELASTGDDGSIRRWDAIHWHQLDTIDSAKAHAKSWLSYSRDGHELISCESPGTLRVWSRDTGKEIRAVQVGQSGTWQPALSPDGRILVVGVDKSIVQLEYPSLKTIRRFPQTPVFGSVIAISPDGEMIASCDNTPQITLSTMDGTELGTLNHATNVCAFDFSPDGRTLVSGDKSHEVHIWDVQRRQERAVLRGHNFWVWAVRFSPDGKIIASGGDDGTVRLWRSD
jgi:WD40 repeat protein